VGVYFVTQNPLDVPDTVLGQLGNRVQHALRAFTPRDQKAVQAAAETMRPNPAFDAQQAIQELGVGEALVSFLDEKGRPTIVERAFVVPPASRIGPIDDAERAALIGGSLVAGVYEKTVDRESAYERLKGRAMSQAAPAGNGGAAAGGAAAGGAGGASTPPAAPPAPAEHSTFDKVKDSIGGILVGGTGRKDSVVEAMAKSAARTIGSQIGREILRGVLGSMFGSKRR
jgi:DNA helicase HerA-like ATPase